MEYRRYIFFAGMNNTMVYTSLHFWGNIMKQNGLNKYINDILLISFFVITGVIFLVVFLLFGKNGSYVTVRVSGQEYINLPLTEDTQIEIAGKNNNKNTLVIENGKAYISNAQCPDGLCVKMGHISKVGQSVICLPNEIVVEIVSDNETLDFSEDKIDIYTGGIQ